MSLDKQLQKQKVRQTYLQKRQQFWNALSHIQKIQIMNRVLESSLNFLTPQIIIGSYENFGGEVPTTVLNEMIEEIGVLALPVINGYDEMNYFDSKKPIIRKPDFVFIPGVAFTRRGHRIGRGKAHFDNYLKHESTIQNDKNPIKVGLAYDFQILEELPIQEHDICMDEIIVISTKKL